MSFVSKHVYLYFETADVYEKKNISILGDNGSSGVHAAKDTDMSAVAYWFVLSPRNQRVDGSFPAQCVYP